jgi:hypothetical protein
VTTETENGMTPADFFRYLREKGLSDIPLDRAEWAAFAIKLANFEPTDDFAELADLVWFFQFGAHGLRFGPSNVSDYRRAFPKDAAAKEHWLPVLLPQRDWLREVLTGALVNRDRARAEHAARIRKRFRRLREIGVPDFREGSIRSRSILIAENPDATTGYMAALLLDRTLPYAARLSRCGLQECGAFFLVRLDRYRGNRNAFCSPKHTEEGKRRQARKRAHKWRQARRSK